MMTYTFLQQYWWLLVSLLGAFLVMLMFVQGGQTLICTPGYTEGQRRMLLSALGRKWELTFTALVTFGGAFFASFPLFYSTSFGGAYALWMLILFCFVLQAVSYEFMHKRSNLLGSRTYRVFLVLNGLFGPMSVGVVVGTFFFGAQFVVNKAAMASPAAPGAISAWANPLHGLEAVADIRNVLLGFAVLMLSRCLAHLYVLNRIADERLCECTRRMLPWETALFLLFFSSFFGAWICSSGWVVNDRGDVVTEPLRNLHALLSQPAAAVLLSVGVVLVITGLLLPSVRPNCRCGIRWAAPGSVLTVTALLLCAGRYAGGVYYPSSVHTPSSLTLANSCSSEFTLRVMSCVSLFIPCVLFCIAWAWRASEREPIVPAEAEQEEH